MENERTCTRCGFLKSVECFYDQSAYKGRKARKQSICVICVKNDRKEKYEKDPIYRKKKLDIARQWQIDNPERKKDKELKCYYGIGLKQYNQMLDEQNGLCAICNKPESRKKVAGGVCMLHVDHNHKNGKVRKLLCFKCNAALGGFCESVDLLKKAIQYLETHS